MQAFLNLCGKATVSACAFSAGTPAATTAKWNTLLRRLLRHPLTIGSPAQTWTYQDVIIAFPEYSFSVWPTDAAILQQLWLASTAPPVPAGAPPFSQEPQDGNLEQILAVGCADSPNPHDPRAYEAAAKLAYARSGAFGPSFAWMHEPCAMWPRAAAQDRYTGPWNRPTANPILLLGNTGDPSTPYSNSVALSHDLARARLLTMDGYGHTEFTNPSTCAENYEVGYLITGALPPAGTVCMIQEALTNTLKHAPGAAGAQVRLAYLPGEVELEVADAGPPGGVDAPGTSHSAAGHGIAGMRERAAVFGGQVSAGPHPGGGWRVHTVLRLSPAPVREGT